MKRFLSRVVLVSLLLAGIGGSAFAQGRIATVDLNKAFNNYWKKKEAEAALKEHKADMDKEFKSLLDDRKKAMESYQKLINEASDQAVSSEERDKRKKLAEDKLKEVKSIEESITQYDKRASNELGERQKRVRDDLLTEITNVTVAKAKAAGYAMVLDVAATTPNDTRVVLYSNNENDITEAVISDLNAAAPSAAKADDKPDTSKKGSKK